MYYNDVHLHDKTRDETMDDSVFLHDMDVAMGVDITPQPRSTGVDDPYQGGGSLRGRGEGTGRRRSTVRERGVGK